MNHKKFHFVLAFLATSFSANNLFAQDLTTDGTSGDDAQQPIVSPHVATVPAADQPTTPSKPSFGYKKGFFIADGDNKLSISARVQSRLEFTSEDTADDRNNKSAFSIPRARLTLKGTAYTKQLSYKFQTDFGKGSTALKDFYIDYRLASSDIRIRTGQFKKPFTRQQIASSSRLEFVDRNIVDKAMGNGRDIGILIHNNFEKSPDLGWNVGVFNGTGDKGQFSGDVTVDPITGEGDVSGGKFSNVPSQIRPAVVARVELNRGGIKGYSEADLEGGPLRYSVAAAAMFHLNGDDSGSSLRAGGDFAVKANGFSTTGGAYLDQQGPDEKNLEYASFGAYLQLGYVWAKTYQPAIRYALVSQDGGNKQHEIAGAFSLYSWGHGLKWQTDIAVLRADNGSSSNDVQARTQFELVF